MALNADEVSAYAGASFFGNVVLTICGTMLKLTFVVSSYVVVGVALPIALALFSLQGLGRFLHYVIRQPNHCEQDMSLLVWGHLRGQEIIKKQQTMPIKSFQ